MAGEGASIVGGGVGEGDGPLTAVVSVNDAEVTVGGRAIWSHVDVTVGPGEFTAVLGPNGAGKSTLIKAIIGLVPLSAGSIEVMGQRPGIANHLIGYLPQRRSFDPGLRVRGRDVVRMGMAGARWGVPLPGRRTQRSRDVDARVDEVIEMVGASSYADRPIGQASGGEQQRLLIAQALVQRPRLLLLDEPLDSLDLPNQAAVAALISDICDEGVAVMLVAHDANPILGYLNRVIYLARGGAVEGTPAEVICSSTLSALYDTPIEVLTASDGRLVVVGHPAASAHHHHHHS